MAIDINLNVTISPSKEAPPWAEQLLMTMLGLTTVNNNIKDMTMAVSASVQKLIDQVAASTSVEAASAAALQELVTQSANLSKQIADLIAAGTAISPEDLAAIDKASTDLADSAQKLQAAVPANVPPPANPAPEIPPATPPV